MMYQKVYDKLIKKFQSSQIEGYVEEHHIIPRCLGGTDDPNNIVRLTAKVHFIAHYLLVKIYPDCRGLWYAFNLMSGKSSRNHKRDYHIGSRVYEMLKINMSRLGIAEETKKKISETLTGRKISKEHKANMIAARTGSKRPEDTKERMKAAQKKRAETYVVSEESREKMRAAKLGKQSPNKGKVASEETRVKMRAAKVGKPGSRLGVRLTEEQKIKAREAKEAKAIWQKEALDAFWNHKFS